MIVPLDTVNKFYPQWQRNDANFTTLRVDAHFKEFFRYIVLGKESVSDPKVYECGLRNLRYGDWTWIHDWQTDLSMTSPDWDWPMFWMILPTEYNDPDKLKLDFLWLTLTDTDFILGFGTKAETP